MEQDFMALQFASQFGGPVGSFDAPASPMGAAVPKSPATPASAVIPSIHSLLGTNSSDQM
jgi:hypothetical protein